MTDERLAELKAIKADIKEKMKEQPFSNPATKDKDALLEAIEQLKL